MRAFWKSKKSIAQADTTGVKVKNERPPVWDSVCLAFKINPVNCLFTYGDTIYNPDNVVMPEDILEHEKLHIQQQTEMSPELWWGKYLRDPQFRVDQEAKAYGRQYKYLAGQIKDRNELHRRLSQLAQILSSKLYDQAIDYTTAMLLIKQYAGLL